jgi:hypothetical protein
VFILGRIVYSVSYARDPEKRGAGFAIAAIATIVLLLGGLAGTIRLLIVTA